MNATELKLGVNVDHVATLRQARGTEYPSVLQAAKHCEVAGALGITVHLREDRRHIQTEDVYDLKRDLQVPLNLEMASDPAIVDIACDLKPAEVCIVPEKREELTTEGGLDVVGQKDVVAQAVTRMKDEGIEVSLFIEADDSQIEVAKEIGAQVVELHTGHFCDVDKDEAEKELQRLVIGARKAHGIGLKVNAGHGINIHNIASILDMPYLDTLNIGHSIIARAVFLGIEGAVEEMVGFMSKYEGGKV